jgi:hypothetical protein
MKSSVDNVMRTPQVHHHVVQPLHSLLIHGEHFGGHVHKVLAAMLAAKEGVDPALDGTQGA